MTWKGFTAILAGLLAALFMQACSTAPATGQDERLVRHDLRKDGLAGMDDWAIEARLAVNDGSDGGSGKLRWHEGGDRRQMDFHGALGRGAWRLESTADGAQLELADGRSYRAVTVGELVREQLGWSIPVEALSWWVLGLEAPGSIDSRSLDENGTLRSLSQQGWEIEFDRYRDVGGIDMPHKMTASQADKSVKLAVRQWTLGAGHE